jgi:hypothetical protein
VMHKGRHENGPFHIPRRLGATARSLRQRRYGRAQWPLPRIGLRLRSA